MSLILYLFFIILFLLVFFYNFIFPVFVISPVVVGGAPSTPPGIIVDLKKGDINDR